MFTGIVEETGELRGREETADGLRLRIGAETVLRDVEHGASISVSGVCLTVEAYDTDDGWFSVFLADETRAKTYLGDLTVGDAVNLERALRADDRLDGHFVQGHVDTVTEILDVERVGEDWRFTVALPSGYEQYVVEKGSVALDGISLTVAELDDDRFAVAIIPTTYDLTTLATKEAGDPVHVEVDVIAKYAERMLSGYA